MNEYKMNKEEIVHTYKIDVKKEGNSIEIDFEIIKHEIEIMDLVLGKTKNNYNELFSPKLIVEEGSIILRWKINAIFNKHYNITDEKEKIFGSKTSEIYLEINRLKKILSSYKRTLLKLSDTPNSRLSEKYNDVDIYDILYEGKRIEQSTTKIAFEIYKKLKRDESVAIYEKLIKDESFDGETTQIFYNGELQNREVKINKKEIIEIHQNSILEIKPHEQKILETRSKEKVIVKSIPRNIKKQSIGMEFNLDGVKKVKTYEFEGNIIIDGTIANDYAIVDYEIYSDNEGNNKRINILKIHEVYSKLKTEEINKFIVPDEMK